VRDRSADKRLRWAFGLALLVHAAALAAASQVPERVGPLSSDFGEIRVFEGSAPAFASRVELVEWPAESGAADAAAAAGGLVLVGPEPEVLEAPRSRVISPPESVKPAAEPVRPVSAPPVEEVAEPEVPREVIPEPVEPEVAPTEQQADPPGDGAAPGGGGGGGGGFVDLGSPSPAGTVAGVASGGTPAGTVPGQGPGTGSGVGPGSGSGSGGGSGSGVGVGDGTGSGEGSGSGTGGGTGSGGSGTGGSGFSSRVADRQEPEVISKGSLEYPAAAVRDGAEGTVRLRVRVSEKGQVAEVEVLESSGDRRLDAAAEEFVRQWRYQPAVQDGEPRRVDTHARVTFRLN